jgi:serine-type D-Ala-D-Ala carboxypeptidase/endopeptidase
MNNPIASVWCDRVTQPYRKRHGGAVAALLTADQTVFKSYGKISAACRSPPSENTIFEIGSITKVFTAILMCRLAVEGRLDLDQPVSRHLPGFERLPDWITPRALATHTSGLPRIPDGIQIADVANPYAGIGEAELRQWVSARKTFTPPTPGKMAYSNFGVGLLGLALGKIHGAGYRAALQEHVLGPLAMKDTDTVLSAETRPRAAQPHGRFGREVPIWDFDALAGCGALKSTAADLILFSKAVIAAANGGQGPLSEAIRTSLEVQVPGAKPFVPDVCLGWMRLKDKASGVGIYDHDGGTGGSSSSLFICPEKSFAILCLANTKSGMLTAIRQIKSDPAGMLGEIIAGQS